MPGQGYAQRHLPGDSKYGIGYKESAKDVWSKLKTVDKLTITAIVDNDLDLLSKPCGSCCDPMSGIKVQMQNRTPNQRMWYTSMPIAAHGYSLYVVAEIGDEKQTLLWDAGPLPDVFERNANRI